MRAALVYNDSNKVENVIELPDDYDPSSSDSYSAPPFYEIVIDANNEAIVGGSFADGVWSPPAAPQVPEFVPSIQQQFDVLTDLLVSKGVITESERASFKGS